MSLVEPRSTDRVRCLLRARILFNNNNSTIDCVIKNISETGAKIALNTETTVPVDFNLEIPARGQTLRARIIWRDTDSIGVGFVEQMPAAPETITSGDVARLEKELRKLKSINLILTKRLEDLGQDVSIKSY